MDIQTITHGDMLTKTFGDKRSGSVETIYYSDNTVELWYADTDTMERIHIEGLTDRGTK